MVLPPVLRRRRCASTHRECARDCAPGGASVVNGRPWETGLTCGQLLRADYPEAERVEIEYTIKHGS